MVQADDETHEYEPAPLHTEALLDPIRIAVQAFVGNVDNTSKQMTAAAERFAQDYAQLINVAAEARRRAAAERAARLQEAASAQAQAPETAPVAAEPSYQEPQLVMAEAAEPIYAQAGEPAGQRSQEASVEDLQRSAVAVTHAASMAADAARDAAAGAAGLTISAAQIAANEATDRRLQRLEEDIGVLTGLMRELFDQVSVARPGAPAQQPVQKKEPNPKVSRRFRMRAAREARQDLQSERRRSA